MLEDLHISGQANMRDGAKLAKLLSDDVLGRFKGHVADEERVALRAGRVSKRLRTVVRLVLEVVPVAGRLGGGEVDVGLTVVDQRTLLGLEGSGRIRSVDKLDVAKAGWSQSGESNNTEEERSCHSPLGTAGGPIADDPGAAELAKLLELTSQPLLVDVPAEIANEEVLDTVTLTAGLLGLRLLGAGSGGVVGLALLGHGLLFGLILAAVIRIGRVIAGSVRRVIIRGILDASTSALIGPRLRDSH